MDRKRNAILEKDRVYQNKGGGKFRCLTSWEEPGYGSKAEVRNVASGWRCLAHNVTLYEDGSIEWDYSTGGFFDGAKEATAC